MNRCIACRRIVWPWQSGGFLSGTGLRWHGRCWVDGR